MTTEDLKKLRDRFETKNEMVDEILETLCYLSEYPKDNKHQIKYYKSILKKMLEEELVEGSLFVKDISQMYPFKYPTNTTTSVRGFKQFEVVLDITPKYYKNKYVLAVILDIFEGIYKGENDDTTQEVRVDSNGVMCDEYLKKAKLNDVMKYLNFRSECDLKMLKAILYCKH